LKEENAMLLYSGERFGNQSGEKFRFGIERLQSIGNYFLKKKKNHHLTKNEKNGVPKRAVDTGSGLIKSARRTEGEKKGQHNGQKALENYKKVTISERSLSRKEG